MAAQATNIIEELAETLDGHTEEIADDNQPGYEADGEVEKKPAEVEETVKEAEVEPVKVAEPDDTAREDVSKKTIPYGRFREVNEQRKEAQAKAEETSREVSQLRGQMAEFLRQQGETPKTIPDPNSDPDGYIAHIRAEHARLTNEMQTIKAEQTKVNDQSAYATKVNNYVTKKVESFMEEHPDYPIALQHLQTAIVQGRINDGDSLAGAQEYYQQVAVGELERMFRTGGDPAKMAYNLAKRYGYKTAEEVAAETNGKKSVTKAKVIDKEKGKEANRSIATAGKAAEVDLDAIDVDSMTPSQFQEFVARQKRASRGIDFP